ncbi:hypothetical protein [Desulfovibrio intestinalis]|uniref:Uncharacterized protein n=1 Tax=Desulfovibrio intestinalis TaxID=58621 RepID=A0A7W8C0S2_9BACT|nr:hypothetical protein [Desulfovibrio intestinalis]MBB5143530.1 hypothetical protein [Desulfovibrio intestinalis]
MTHPWFYISLQHQAATAKPDTAYASRCGSILLIMALPMGARHATNTKRRPRYSHPGMLFLLYQREETFMLRVRFLPLDQDKRENSMQK